MNHMISANCKARIYARNQLDILEVMKLRIDNPLQEEEDLHRILQIFNFHDHQRQGSITLLSVDQALQQYFGQAVLYIEYINLHTLTIYNEINFIEILYLIEKIQSIKDGIEQTIHQIPKKLTIFLRKMEKYQQSAILQKNYSLAEVTKEKIQGIYEFINQQMQKQTLVQQKVTKEALQKQMKFEQYQLRSNYEDQSQQKILLVDEHLLQMDHCQKEVKNEMDTVFSQTSHFHQNSELLDMRKKEHYLVSQRRYDLAQKIKLRADQLEIKLKDTQERDHQNQVKKKKRIIQQVQLREKLHFIEKQAHQQDVFTRKILDQSQLLVMKKNSLQNQLRWKNANQNRHVKVLSKLINMYDFSEPLRPNSTDHRNISVNYSQTIPTSRCFVRSQQKKRAQSVATETIVHAEPDWT